MLFRHGGFSPLWNLVALQRPKTGNRQVSSQVRIKPGRWSEQATTDISLEKLHVTRLIYRLLVEHEGPLVGRPYCSYIYTFGNRTASITWITPLSASMSAVETFALLTLTPPSVWIVTSLPLTVTGVMPSERSVDITLPETT